MDGWEAALMIIGTVAALVTAVSIWRGLVWPRIVVASTLLAVAMATLGSWMLGAWPFEYNPFHDVRHVGFLVIATGLAALALPFRLVAARWVALGLAVSGIISGAMNTLTMTAFSPQTHCTAPVSWTFIIGLLWSATLWMTLAGPTMRKAFIARSSADTIWGSSHRLVGVIRWTALANLVAIPMLLVYTWAQPVVAQTSCWAFSLALLLGVGTALTLSRKVVGAVLLSVSGVGLLFLSLATISIAGGGSLWLTGYYAVFWVPAGLLSLVCAVMLVKPVFAILRDASSSKPPVDAHTQARV